jgi:hydroxymethylglutaryl-CoA lyase
VVLGVARFDTSVAGWLDGEPTHGAMWRAGLPRTFAAAAAA